MSRLTRFLAALITPALAGCAGESHWRPPVGRPTPLAAVPGDPPDAAVAGHRVVVLVMLPGYGTADQVRAGNMGHVAIEVGGRLHDVGSMNGYAFPFAATAGVRCWPFADADAAVAALVGHPDSDGTLDSITRFDLDVTAAQAATLERWWAALDAKAADPANRLYYWHGLQCATAVADSLRAAGVADAAVLSPDDLCGAYTARLRHTAGPRAGRPATVTVVQVARKPAGELGLLSLVTRWPGAVTAGRRTAVAVPTPDGVDQPVLWSDGDAYRERVRSFAVAPAEAVRRAGVPGAQAVPNFAVGRWYHVYADHVIGQANLGGCYVNGDDGRVVRVADDRVIRFDAFDGDRVVPGRGG